MQLRSFADLLVDCLMHRFVSLAGIIMDGIYTVEWSQYSARPGACSVKSVRCNGLACEGDVVGTCSAEPDLPGR